jgi:(p)ppGpp synthase/HD superfamily hydrolase
MPATLTARFEDALVYAASKHAAQRKKGSGVPYIAHLLGVASIALDYGADEDEAIGALLHDVVEDQGGQAAAQEIRQRFGNAVADIVVACSDTDVLPKPPWEERKQRYVAHVRTASRSVALVSASDKLYNAQSIVRDHRRVGEAVWSRFSAPKDKNLWYYGALVAAFKNNPAAPQDLVGELERVVAEMHGLR